LETSQVGAELLKLRDLTSDGRQILPHECEHMLARGCPLVPDCKDTADVSERHPERLRPADEAEALDRVLAISSVTRCCTLSGTHKANTVVVTEGLRLDAERVPKRPIVSMVLSR
jgi:hypothetical protein